jgi:structural maintenance of chromosome 1
MRAADRLNTTQSKLKETAKEWESSRKSAVKAKKDFEDVKAKRLELFQKAFDHISENIGGTYKDLTKDNRFPLGGQAYLDMEDSTEPYMAGLKYHAMPPLKRFRDMEHLSGGEKTIAALALLFAIHSYQPSPFFVLDEVDAALDNVNVGRVAQYVKEHASPGMQFIVISLKAGFFQESESLVGVMRDQAKMSSRVVSLDVSFMRLWCCGACANFVAVEEVSTFIRRNSHSVLSDRNRHRITDTDFWATTHAVDGTIYLAGNRTSTSVVVPSG